MGDRVLRIKAMSLISIFVLLWVFAFGRLFYLQIVQSRDIGRKSRTEQVRHLETPARRGEILDKKGRILATDLKLFTLYAEKSRIVDIETTAKTLAKYGIGSATRLESLLLNNSGLIRIARGVSDSVVRKLNLEGIYAVREWFRYYPSGRVGRTAIGSLNWEKKGISGIEREYNKQLAGSNGWAYYLEVPRYSGISLLKRCEENYEDPIPGRDIYLTIDLDIQYILDSELRKLGERTKADQVFGLCIDSRTGEILAMVNIPEFLPEDGWRNNGCVAWQFEPGSIFKLIPAFAWINEGYSLGDTVVGSTGSISFGGKVFKDPHSHPAYTFEDALVHSSNAGFVNIGEKIGKRELYRCARYFGIGCKTGVDLPVEYSGKLPILERMRDIRLATVSFGQGVNTTPLQIVMAYQAIANGGVLLRPRVMKEIRRKGRIIEKSRTEVVRRIGDRETALKLLEILYHTVEKGTGELASLPYIKIAGKTGTAWKYSDGSYRKGEYVSSFVGILPYPDPELVIGIFLDNPKGPYYSSVTVCPAFKEVARRITFLKGYRGEMLYAFRGTP
jgi:stage V sporulation protein D (sporulation-specific penicillin-binding protein)